MLRRVVLVVLLQFSVALMGAALIGSASISVASIGITSIGIASMPRFAQTFLHL
jgi:hypothetical protein